MNDTVNEPINRRILLAARPAGLPKPSDWSIESLPVGPLAEGEAVVKVRLLSLDPAMRGWMNEGRSYVAPVGLGEVMRAIGIGEVVQSRRPDLPVGTHVSGAFGVQQYCRIDASGPACSPVDLAIAPAEKWLNPLGMPGMTAYFGLLEVGQPQPGQTVVVSGAAGAVGQTVGQIAKIKGCRAVGIAGGKAKCDFVVDELGFDACIDYKGGDLKGGLKAACPDGVDVYFDNVGGSVLDTVLTRITRHARIVVCGAISQYNNTEPVRGPANYLSLLVNRARMEGMVVFDYADRYPQAIADIAGWLAAGRFKSREDVVDGLETFPERLLMLFSGQNFGKLILRVA
jgi:NADPH-dependent curcumin reductase CurA